MIHKKEWAKTLSGRDLQKLECLYQFAQQIFSEAQTWDAVDFDCNEQNCKNRHKTVLRNGWYLHIVPWENKTREKQGICFKIFQSPNKFLHQLHVNGNQERFSILAYDPDSLLGIQFHFDHEEYVKTRYPKVSKNIAGFITQNETAVLKARDIEFLFLALPSWAVHNTHSLPMV